MADTNLIYTTQPNGIIVGNGSNGQLTGGSGSSSAINTKPYAASTVKKREEHDEPPDGGARAIVVMISAFLCNSILFGVINTYGTVYLTLHRNLESDGDPEASSKAGEAVVRFILLLQVIPCMAIIACSAQLAAAFDIFCHGVVDLRCDIAFLNDEF